MAQQSKNTSRTLTKALGTASILGMAIAGANMANALQTDFAVEYQAHAFAVSSDAFTDPAAQPTVDADGRGLPANLGGTPRDPAASETDTGLANLLRVKANFKDEETGVSLHTSIQLAGDRWSGDSREEGGLAYQSQGNESVTLDLGYVQVPLGGNLLRVGRQTTSWANCLVVCDDRRDRVSMIFPTSVGTFVTNYDRRADTNQFFNADNGDGFSAAYLTRLGGFNVGFLYAYWAKNTNENVNSGLREALGAAPSINSYALHNTNLVSAYTSGEIADGITLDAGVNYIGGNDTDLIEDNLGVVGAESDGRIYADSAWSGYVKVGADVGMVEVAAQWLGTKDGGLVSPGYDTFSSLINSSPESTANPTSLYRVGGASGMENFDENLFIAKAGFNLTPQLKLTGAVGTLMVDNGEDDDSSMVYDVRADYQINEKVSTSLTWGMVSENDVGETTRNPLVGASAGGVSFADDDLMAAALGLNVKF